MDLSEPELLHMKGGKAALANSPHTFLSWEYLQFHRKYDENSECGCGISLCHV